MLVNNEIGKSSNAALSVIWDDSGDEIKVNTKTKHMNGKSIKKTRQELPSIRQANFLTADRVSSSSTIFPIEKQYAAYETPIRLMKFTIENKRFTAK